MLTLALVALAGCKKKPVPGPGGKTPSITFITDRETGEQIVLGFDLNETSLGDGFDSPVEESLLFPYGGIRNDDGSYSDVGTCSFMIVQSYFGFGMSGWGWYMFPGSVDTDYGYVRCIREKLWRSTYK